MKNLIIIGASGHGMVIADIAKLFNLDVNFWDDNENKRLEGFNVLKRRNKVPKNTKLIIGIGDNITRKKISCLYPVEVFRTLIHPRAIISKDIKMGIGNVLMPGVCINSGVIIGDHCIFNTGGIVEHNCLIENFVHLSPNATLCGGVKIREGSWIGAGATIIQGIEIGKHAIIAAGAVIIDDIPDGACVIGNPGRITKINQAYEK